LDYTQAWFSQLLRYFENSIQDIPTFWQSVPKEIEDYPRPPWWFYEKPDKFSPNPCAIIASALILHGTEPQKLMGLRVAEKCFEFLLSKKKIEMHDCYNLIALIEKLQSVKSPLITDEIVAAMKRNISSDVCYDETKWGEYNTQPLDYAPSPNSEWHDCVKDGIENNLNYWLKNLNNDGVWNPNFSWGVNSPESKQATKNWTGFITDRRIKILKNYNMI
jgi:hypothetical protein